MSGVVWVAQQAADVASGLSSGARPDWYWALMSGAAGVRPDWYWAVMTGGSADWYWAAAPGVAGARSLRSALAPALGSAGMPTAPARAAQLTPTSGTELRDVLLAVMGTFLLVVVAARGLAAFAEERYGKIVMLVLAAVPVAGVCYFPAQATELLKGLFTLFFGGG